MKDSKSKILKLFLLTRIPLIYIIILSLIKEGNLSGINIYDASNYLKIAQNGYIKELLYAFFPLYPLLIKIFSHILPYYDIVGLIISNICSYFTIKILYELYDDKDKIKIYLTCPILIYTSIAYTESLFILLTVLGYYLYKKNKLYLSSIIIGLSALTRNTGYLLILSIGIDIIYRKYIKKDINTKTKTIIICAIISLTISSLYPLYLYIKTKNPLMFITSQNLYWGRKNMFVIKAFISDLKYLHTKNYNIFIIYVLIQNWLSYIYALYIAIKISKKDLVSSIYIILTIIVLSVSFRDISYWNTLPSISMFRYIWALFPLYLYIKPTKKMQEILLIICTINYILISQSYFLA